MSTQTKDDKKRIEWVLITFSNGQTYRIAAKKIIQFEPDASKREQLYYSQNGLQSLMKKISWNDIRMNAFFTIQPIHTDFSAEWKTNKKTFEHQKAELPRRSEPIHIKTAREEDVEEGFFDNVPDGEVYEMA